MQIEKNKFDNVPEVEKAFYINVGHLRNELMILVKFLKASVNKPSDNPILVDVQMAQTFLISRILAGKVWEGWQLVKQLYVGTPIQLAIENELPEEIKSAFRELEQYFEAKKNLINMVRNRFAFHYDPSQIKKQLKAVDQTDKLKIYIGEKEANVFYQMSETIATKAMLDAIEPGNFEGANVKLMKEVTEISPLFIKFCDGCLLHMSDNYLSLDGLIVDPEEVELPDTPGRDETHVPFFTE